jgi:hypothetical protein
VELRIHAVLDRCRRACDFPAEVQVSCIAQGTRPASGAAHFYLTAIWMTLLSTSDPVIRLTPGDVPEMDGTVTIT